LAVLAGCVPAGGGADSTNTAAVPAAGVQERSLLEPSSPAIDLGIVPQAGAEQERFELTNMGEAPVRVTRIRSSCPCLKLEPIPLEVPPGGTVPVLARLDLSSEPHFAGGLSITVAGYTPAGKLAFQISVDATVRNPATEQATDRRKVRTTN
jgi:hypothetical protein